MCDDESILAGRLAQREDHAWEEFCRAYSSPLLAVVRLRFNCSQELAEEIVQMTFIRCVKAIHTFDPGRGRLFDWLKAIARNEAYTLLRKLAPKGQVELGPENQDWLECIDQAELPDERLCRAEVRTMVLDAIMELSSHYRQVLVMKYLENRRVAEMALALGQSEKAIESLLTRSRQALKELLTRRLRKPAVPGGNWL
ncbi:MAG TPA: sigma-70 family RNA polymerase sigma factor [Candidatus Sulfotelmatobacter sp.]|nr:sigma-70 family RNA polymerase sigma factor [Candidatus Sulfotelmatobacter sp.]HWI57669.1 sigma-70 family RNA polymerase sigma factor [Bacillota bacterium]